MKRLLPFIALAAVSVLSVFSCQQEPEEIRVGCVSLSKSALELTVGEQASLDVTISPDNATNKKIRWSSSKESVATITPEGIVEAVSAGTAFITATSEDSGVSAKCEITVKEKVVSVTGIALNKTSLTLTEGEEFTLEATVTPDNATNKDVIWTSDNEAVATVSAEGVVKALRTGSANVIVTTVDQGKTASCAITVAEKMGAVTGEATHISCRNAKLSGKVTLSQTTAINLSFGVLYSTSSGVLLGSATQLEAKDFDADYNYTIDTGVLEPETTYYYRSYIIQNDEVEYGETKSFKTLTLSSMIQTLDASDVVPKEATLNAMLDLTDCNYSSIEYGFELTPEGGQAKTLAANNLSDKAFSYRDETLVKNTGYSYAAYVKLDDVLYKGEPKTFTTASIQASVTAEASAIKCKSATISGRLTVQSEGSFSKSAVLYYSSSESTLEGLKSKGTRKTLTLGADGSYSETLSSLFSSTSYNFIVVTQVDDVEFVTEIKSFKTLTIQASVSAEASAIDFHSAVISGRLAVQSEGSFFESAELYYSSSESTLEGLRSNGVREPLTLGEDGSYSEVIYSWLSSTSYNFVVVAQVDDVEFVTEIKSFKTLTIQASVTAEASAIKCKSATISGRLTVQSEGSFSKSAVLYYSSSESTLEGLRSNGVRKALTLGADGSYSETLSSLTSSTSYNFIVVAQVDDVEFVTEIKSFKTLTIQASVTAEASEIQCKSAAISGWLSVQSEGSFSKSAVLYYSSSESTLEGLKSKGTRKTLTLGADGSYSKTLSSLSSSTSYNFVVVAQVDDVEFVTEIKSFKTLTIQASVTAEASSIQYYAATISGRFTVQSEGSFSKSAVLYYSSSESTLEGLKSKGTRKTLTLGADGSYSKTLSSLSSSTSYNFVVVATVDDVEFASQIGNFSTLSIQASVTAEASDVKFHSAIISGSLNIQSEGSFSKSAVLYYSSSESTLEGLRSNGVSRALILGSYGSYYSKSLSSLTSSTAYNFVVVAKVDDVEFASQIGNFSTLEFPIPSQVDLGLSVKWASCNLGASKPTEYGGCYFQWAGTKDVSDTSIFLEWGNCPYHTGSDADSGWSKYNTESSYGTVDNKIVLEAKDDAASVALGGKWRIPTDKEWEELRNTDNCSWTWTTIDGVKGYKVQSKKSGYTDNWIFLPPAGYRYYYSLYDVGFLGYYWSSSLDTDNPYSAYIVLFGSGGFRRGDNYRYFGLSVRPVSE